MQRRKFLASTVLGTALGVTGPQCTATAGRNATSFVVKAGKSRFNETTRINGVNANDIKLSTKDTDGALSIFEYVGREKGGPPLHVHPNQDELFYVVEGEYLFVVGDTKQRLTVGDTIFLPRNVPHTFAQLSEQGKLLFFFQPSGKMEDFFRTIGSLTGPPSPQEGARLFADHDMQVVGPPLATN